VFYQCQRQVWAPACVAPVSFVIAVMSQRGCISLSLLVYSQQHYPGALRKLWTFMEHMCDLGVDVKQCSDKKVVRGGGGSRRVCLGMSATHASHCMSSCLTKANGSVAPYYQNC
jgi:hypothetical protein